MLSNSKKLWQQVEVLLAKIFSYKITYFVLGVTILTQFILVSIIFFEKSNSCSFRAEEEGIESKLNEIDEKLNSIESKQMFMQSQLYRIKQPSTNN